MRDWSWSKQIRNSSCDILNSRHAYGLSYARTLHRISAKYQLPTRQVNPYDPGICTKKERGKFVVVKDYNDDDKIVACVRHDGKYQWEIINGND